MSRNPPRQPAYRLHKASGRAVVTFGRQDHYLGPYGSEESRREYDRLVAEWLANGRRTPTSEPLAVKGLVRRYLEHVRTRYRSNEPETIEAALKPVFQLYGDVPDAEFGPLALEAVRARYVANGHVRGQVNKRTRCVVRMFKWAVAKQLLPPAVWQALSAVEGIPKGTPGTKEGKKVRPVADAWVDAVLPFVSRQVAAMIQVQRLTGARPGEVCSMRTCDLVTAGRVWEYRPAEHKTDHLDRERVIFVGPEAQEVLRPFLRPATTEHLFCPREAEAERMAALRAARKSKVQPSQVDRRKLEGPRRPDLLGDRYTTNSYRTAVTRGIERANAERRKAGLPEVPHWHPHRIRHTAATELRRKFGVDVARAVLGHSSPAVTEIYAELDAEKAREAMERMG